MLYLLPNLLHEEADPALWLPPIVGKVASELDGLFAESEKGGRYFLRRFHPRWREVPTHLLNEHTEEKELIGYLAAVQRGGKWGLISDAGLPCIADPGAQLVALARKAGVHVAAYPGPSSVVQTLLLSGLPSQHFTFHGYLERDVEKLKRQLTLFPKGVTHLFIEAPYRNQKLLTLLLEQLPPDTLLCTACDLTAPSEEVLVKKVGEWRRGELPDLHKRATVFAIWY